MGFFINFVHRLKIYQFVDAFACNVYRVSIAKKRFLLNLSSTVRVAYFYNIRVIGLEKLKSS